MGVLVMERSWSSERVKEPWELGALTVGGTAGRALIVGLRAGVGLSSQGALSPSKIDQDKQNCG